MESLEAGRRVRLDVVDGLHALAAFDEATMEKFFRGIRAEILEAPDAEGSFVFRHVVDMRAALEAGVWAPWTCVAQHVAEDDSREDAWLFVTRMYARRVAPSRSLSAEGLRLRRSRTKEDPKRKDSMEAGGGGPEITLLRAVDRYLAASSIIADRWTRALLFRELAGEWMRACREHRGGAASETDRTLPARLADDLVAVGARAALDRTKARWTAVVVVEYEKRESDPSASEDDDGGGDDEADFRFEDGGGGQAAD